MKIIMMAAGMGVRLNSVNKGKAKSLIKFNDEKTLLDLQIESMRNSGVIDEIIMILGYQNEKILEKIKSYNKKIKIKTFLNPFYKTTNNLVSLWFARSEMTDDFLITNGDNYFKSEVFKQIVKSKTNGFCLAVTIKDRKNYGGDYMKILLSNKKNVTYASKSIKNSKANAISTGLFLVSGKKNAIIFKQILDELVIDAKSHKKFWLEGINLLYKKGFLIKSLEVDGKNMWREIDYPEDISSLKSLIQ